MFCKIDKFLFLICGIFFLNLYVFHTEHLNYLYTPVPTGTLHSTPQPTWNSYILSCYKLINLFTYCNKIFWDMLLVTLHFCEVYISKFISIILTKVFHDIKTPHLDRFPVISQHPFLYPSCKCKNIQKATDVIK